MNDDDILDAGRKLAHEAIHFLCDEIEKYPYRGSSERDAVILYALMRLIISKIIHRSKTKNDADVVFKDFVTSLKKTWDDQEFAEERGSLH